MDEDTKKLLLSWAQEGGAFVKEQAPLYAQEVLAWQFWVSILGAILGLLLIGFACYLAPKAKARLEDYSGDEAVLVATVLFFLACAIVGPILLCVNVSTAVKVKVAPRVVVIEALRGVAK